MKPTAIFSFCALVSAISAASISKSLHNKIDSGIQMRYEWNNEEADYTGDLWHDKDMDTHNLWSKEDFVVNTQRKLGERSYNYDIYERQEVSPEEIEDAVKVAKDIVTGIINIVKFIKGKIEHDKKMRGQYTDMLVKKMSATYPKFNFAVCHTKHTTDFKGVKGKDWGHTHHEFKVSFSKTIGYEIYWFRQGTFHRIGDGGYLNWAYDGKVVSTSNQGKDVVFGPR